MASKKHRESAADPENGADSPASSDVTREAKKRLAAEHRVAWRESPELMRLNRAMWGIFGLMPVGAAIGAFAGWSTGRTQIDSKSSALIGAGFGALVIFYVSSCFLVIYSIQLKRSFEDRRLLGLAREDLQQAEKEITGGETDFASLWAVTQKRLDYYHKIATTQSERSFLYGQIAAGTGFAVLLIASVIAGFAASPTASVTAGAVGIAGGGLGAYVGNTFMKSQEAAAAQLREYFLQPLEFSKYLAAERILESLDEKDRTSSVRLLIEAIATGSSSRSVATSDSASPPN